jgi:hypothetical protein
LSNRFGGGNLYVVCSFVIALGADLIGARTKAAISKDAAFTQDPYEAMDSIRELTQTVIARLDRAAE